MNYYFTSVPIFSPFIILTIFSGLSIMVQALSMISEYDVNVKFIFKNKLIITLDIINLDKHFIYYLIDLMKIIDNNTSKWYNYLI